MIEVINKQKYIVRTHILHISTPSIAITLTLNHFWQINRYKLVGSIVLFTCACSHTWQILQNTFHLFMLSHLTTISEHFSQQTCKYVIFHSLLLRNNDSCIPEFICYTIYIYMYIYYVMQDWFHLKLLQNECVLTSHLILSFLNNTIWILLPLSDRWEKKLSINLL